MADHKYVEISDQSFGEQVLKSEQPSVVDFWAPWCRPCLAMAPTFEELAGEYSGKMVFAKLNTDDNQMTAGRLGIQGIPTLIFFRGGREIDRIVGLVPRDVLKRHIESALATAV
ncbi:MAG TPA: thioredoxin [Ktedonobacterales bacterium]|jgi:thioredoxin|nr:thioredoxin [Ktedonobacterales bacterium]